MTGQQEKKMLNLRVRKWGYRTEMVEEKPGVIPPGADKVRRESEWKVNSEEQYGKEDGRREWLKREKIRSCQRTGQKREEYTRKAAASTKTIGLQATILYLQAEEVYFNRFFSFFSSTLFSVLFCLNLCFVSKCSAQLHWKWWNYSYSFGSDCNIQQLL